MNDALRRFYGRLTPTRAAAISIVALVMLITVSVRGVGAAPTHTLSIVPAPASPNAGHTQLEGRTFDQVRTALAGTTTPTVPLPIPGLATIPSVPVQTATDLTNRVVTMTTEAPLVLGLGAASPFAGIPVDLQLTARWDSVLDTNPDVALGIRATNRTLASFYSRWGAIPALPDDIQLSNLVLSITDQPWTLDPATLPSAVKDFYGVDGSPLAQQLALGQVANLRGVLDQTAAATVQSVAQFLGIDSTKGLVLAGSLANTAGILFDTAATTDAAAFSLDGPVAVDSSQLPDWLQNQVPVFKLRLGPAPDRTPSVFVADELDVVTGGTTNHFSYEVSLQDLSDLDVTAQAPTFTPPFGLAWMGPFEDVAVRIHKTGSTLEAEIGADVPITASKPRVQIKVKSATGSQAAEVSVAGDVPLADAISWLGRPSAFDRSFPTAAVGDTTIDGIELTYESTGARKVLGLFASAHGIDTFNASLDTKALLALEDTPSTDPELLVALRVSDPGCNAGKCVKLSQVVPFGASEVAADLTFPAVNFATVLPNGAQFDPTGLGPQATAFLADVLGQAPANPVPLEVGLNFSAELALSDYGAMFDRIGWSPGGTARLQGSLGLTLGALTQSGQTVNVFDQVNLQAQFPGVTMSAPPGLPAWFDDKFTWPSVGASSLFLRFTEGAPGTDADDRFDAGVAISDIETTLLGPSTPSFGVEASFSGNPTGVSAVSLKGVMGQWAQPFDIGFLTVNGAELRIDVPSSGSPSVKILGDFGIGTEQATVEVAISSITPIAASLTVCLVSEITGAEVVSALFGANAPDLPTPFETAHVGPGCISVGATGEGVFTLDAVVDAGFRAFPGRNEIGADLLLSAGYGQGSPRITFGVRPRPGLKLSDLMPSGVTLPIDFQLTPQSLTDGSFALVVSNQPVTVDSPTLPQATRDWYAPLFGGITAGKTVPNGFTALGAFELPDLLGDFVENLGVDRSVTASGNIPLPGLDSVGFGITLGLQANPGRLPEFVESAGIELGLALTVGESPKLEVFLRGNLGVRFKQGADPAITNALTALGVDLDEPIPNPSGTCPRGGLKQPDFRDANGSAALNSTMWCYDVLDLTLEGSLGISLLPPKIEAEIGADLVSRAAIQGDNTKGWAPLGIVDAQGQGVVVFSSAQGRLGVTLEPGPQGAILTLKLGVAGNIAVLGNTVNGGAQIGLTISPLAAPPFFAVVPAFDGLRFALPQGVGVEQLRTLVQAVGTQMPEDINQIPPIQLRNLEFSLSPFGVDDLCIPFGLQLRGDLYVNATVPNNGTGPVCVEGVYTPPANSELCPANEANGCVAGVFISLGANGIRMNGFVKGFDFGPIHTNSALLDLELTTSSQHLQIEGGVTVDVLGSGFMRLKMEPMAIDFEGELKVFNLYQAYVEGQGALNFTDPGFSFHATFRDDSQFAAELQTRLDGLMDPFIDKAEIAKNGFRALSSNENTARDALDALGVGIDEDDDLKPSHQIGGFVEAAAQLGGLSVADWMTNDVALAALDGTGKFIDLALGLGCALPTAGDDDEDGLSDLYGFPCSFSALLNYVGNTLENAFAGAENVGAEFQDVLDRFLAGGGIQLNCATFGGALSLLETGVDLGLDMDVLRQHFENSVSWRFTGDGFTDIETLFEAMLDFVYSEEDENVDCDPPPTTPVGPASGMFLDVADDLLLEGQQAEISGAFIGETFPASVTVDWGDGHTATHSVSGGTFTATHVYGDNGSPYFDVLVTSSQSGTPATAQIRVLNVKPTLNVPLFTGTTAEGSPFSVGTVEFSDVGTLDTHTATIDWGDESPLQAGTVTESPFASDDPDDVLDGTVGFSAHTYADNGAYTVRICLRDDDGGERCTQRVIEITNVAPTVTVPALDSVAEGSLRTLGGTSFTDPSPVDTHTANVNWGDGTGTQAASVNQATRTVSGSHIYADNDVYTVTVCVTDDDGGNDCDSSTVTVTNVAPTVDAGPDATVAEGYTFSLAPATFNDKGTLDTHTATVNWGDGPNPTTGYTGDESRIVSESPFGPPGSTAGANGTVEASHVYADNRTDNGVYTVTVCVTDDDGGSDCDSLQVTVTNVAPTVDAGPDATVAEGYTFSLAPATFNDKGTLDTHPATVHWGDGSYATVEQGGTVSESPSGPPGSTAGANGTVSASHVYADNGPYTVRVCVKDDDGATTCDSLKLTVTNADPTAAFGTVGDGPDFFLPFVDISVAGTLADPGTLDTHTLSVAWGDGSSNAAVVTENPFGPPGSTAGMTGTWATVHAYATAAMYMATATVTDDDGGVGTATRQIEVVTPAEAVRRMIVAINTLLAQPGQPVKVKTALTAALKELEGTKGGKPNPGALDKLVDGDDSAALVKIATAIDYLEDALKAKPDLALRNTLLILTQVAESVSKGLLLEARTLIDPTSPGAVKQIDKLDADHTVGRALKTQALAMWDAGPVTSSARSAAALKFKAAVDKFHEVTRAAEQLGAGR